MGRTNGKLTCFLKNGLQNHSYCNLEWVDINSQTFKLKLPRYERRRDLRSYEKILIDWYRLNNREYTGYSGAKAVIQAALKKSVYLVSLNLKNNINELFFRFASKTEEEEKRKKQKQESKLVLHDSVQGTYHFNPTPVKPEESDLILHDPSQDVSALQTMYIKPEDLQLVPSPSRPPSNSSGYQSGNEDFDESVPMTGESTFSENLDFLDDLDFLQNPDSYLNVLKSIDFDTVFPENGMEVNTLESNNSISSNDMMESNVNNVTAIESNDMINSNMNNVTTVSSCDTIEGSTNSAPLDTIKLNVADVIVSPPIKFPEKPVELTTTEVNSLEVLNTYWLCTKKLNIGSVLQLICEKQVIKDENQGLIPGQIYIGDVVEAGKNYSLEKMFEVDGKFFLFLLQNN